MAGSEYLGMVSNVGTGLDPSLQGNPPNVDATKNRQLYKALFNCVQQDLVASSISINRGGFVTALCKSLIGGGLGEEINLSDVPGSWQKNYQALFSESQGRVLISIAPQNKQKFEQLMKGNVFAQIGRVTKNPTMLINDKLQKPIVKIKIAEAQKNYKATFKDW